MFIYTDEFSKLWQEVFGTQENLKELEGFLLENPKGGKVIKGTSGLRKLRWKTEGKGKRGGLRIFYVDFENEKILYFILLISKNEMPDLSYENKKLVEKIILSAKNNLTQYNV